MDVTHIEPGVSFADAIVTAISTCDVLIAVIGSQWLNCTNRQGDRRLDDPDDFVRLEIALSLERGLRVIPVLIRGASMPRSTELPDDLVELSSRQAIELTDTRWDYDSSLVITAIEKALVPVSRPRTSETKTARVRKPSLPTFNPQDVSKVDLRTWRWESRFGIDIESAFPAADRVLKKLGFATTEVNYPTRIIAAKGMTSGWSALLVTGGDVLTLELQSAGDHDTLISISSRSKQTNLVDPLGTNRKNIENVAKALVEECRH